MSRQISQPLHPHRAADEYRPIAEVEEELNAREEEAKTTDAALKEILKGSGCESQMFPEQVNIENSVDYTEYSM